MMPTNFPGLDEAIDSPHKILLLLEMLGEEGVSAEAGLAGTGLSLVQLADPQQHTSARQLLTVCGNAQRLSRDPALALKAGRRINIMHFGLYGYALLGCATPRKAIAFAIKYRPLAAPIIGLSFQETAEAAVWRFFDVLDLGVDSALFRFVLEFQLGTQLSLHADILGDAVQPLAISLEYARPVPSPDYEGLLACTVLFSQASNELRFARHLMELPLVYANAAAEASVRQTCDAMLADMLVTSNRAGVAGEVVKRLLAHPGQFPDMEAVAADLTMASRTLRRKLQEQGTSFQVLLQAVRQKMAIDYLEKTSMDLEEIAQLVGFNDSANFRHALKKWTGKTPRAFRTASTAK